MAQLHNIGDIVHFSYGRKRSKYCVPAIVIDSCESDGVELLDVGVFNEYYEKYDDVAEPKWHDAKDCPDK